ncbi:MAG: PepSY domain-containing protein [Oscillospiraceae bacterium]|nr:PepSY domain-containing protein [Oscillospiraceae bacterium]
MKKLTVLFIAVTTALFAGCASTGVQISPIGFDAAKVAALEAAGVAVADAVFEESELKEYKGQKYYDVDFKANGNEYEYDIDALTGAVIASETDVKASHPAEKAQDNQPPAQPQPAAETKSEDKPTAQKTELIGEEKAKTAALSHAGVKAADAKFVKTELDRDDGRTVYEVEFYSGNTEYDYDIEAYSGAVLAYDHDAENYSKPAVKQESKPTPAPEAKLIGEEKAKAAALSHAGVKAADAKFVKTELDRDDGRTVYEVEFYSGNTEYDYDIDAYSGAVLAYDHDAENYSKPAVKQESKPTPAPTAKPEENKQQQSAVSEADAKKTALAQVPGAKESDIREFEVDRDDGRIEYEGKIVYDGLEYEFEIDGHSGAIRNWEVEKFEKYDD